MTAEKLNELRVYADAYLDIRDYLNERERRELLARGCMKFGRGAAYNLSKLTGVSMASIRRGLSDIQSPYKLEEGRVRVAGGGRKPIEETYPDIFGNVLEILQSATYGSPEGGKWTSLSLQNISDELAERGIIAERSTLQRIVKELGYSRQKNRKMDQVGKPSPDRSVQFDFIQTETEEAIADGIPVISVDTKKKENIGNFKNDGTEYRPKSEPRNVYDHDFFIETLGKVSPYGVYVLNNNTAFVNLGTSSDTATFAVEGIRRWWYAIGRENFAYTTKIIITCDCGGSNGVRNRLWKLALADLAEEIDREIVVLHYPPGTSKHNKIEHRLFCYITKSWQGKPLIDVPTVVDLIQSTKTSEGLTVRCEVDNNIYQTGAKVDDSTFDCIDIQYIGPHQGWSYIIRGFKI